MQFVFDERKAAQAAGLLLGEAGGSLPYIQLIKLLYLADRKALVETGFPITGARMVSMDHGPVLSEVYSCITVDTEHATPWREVVSAPSNYTVSLQREAGDDRLSDYELDVLRAIWIQFKHMGKWKLRDYTHTLPEWENPHGSACDIDPRRILSDAGYSPEEIHAVADQAEAVRSFRRALA